MDLFPWLKRPAAKPVAAPPRPDRFVVPVESTHADVIDLADARARLRPDAPRPPAADHLPGRIHIDLVAVEGSVAVTLVRDGRRLAAFAWSPEEAEHAAARIYTCAKRARQEAN